ncbi:hypothetical protein [Nonomuraea salmonea]|uniref:hypothetical protein n=1 Tax=Nonomuraea salmonea TaxID=46181 RepID=UPI0031EDF495
MLDVAVPRCADTGGIMVQERLITEGEFPVRPTDGSALVRRVATAVAVDNPWDWDTAFPVDEVAVYPPFLPQGQAMATARTVLVPPPRRERRRRDRQGVRPRRHRQVAGRLLVPRRPAAGARQRARLLRPRAAAVQRAFPGR